MIRNRSNPNYWQNPVPWIVFLLILSFHSGWSQSNVTITGVVIDNETKAPVPLVHIYTPGLTRGTATDEAGRFSIKTSDTDTLIFSSVGFDKYILKLDSTRSQSHYEVVVELNFKTYELDAVNVMAYKNYDSFKKAIVDLNVPNEEKGFKLGIPSDAFVPNNNGNSDMTPNISVTGPISALYNVFSKEAKEKRKLVSYRKISTEQKIISSRYNADVVKRLTNLNDEGVKRFMEWCKFEDDFILKATEYDLSVAMLKCLDEFSQLDTIR